MDVNESEAIEILKDVINQACLGPDGVLDSGGISAYADALKYMAGLHELTITADYGRRVLAMWGKT